jgi:hypothetical protein
MGSGSGSGRELCDRTGDTDPALLKESLMTASGTMSKLDMIAAVARLRAHEEQQAGAKGTK